jgi:hypothetical protein
MFIVKLSIADLADYYASGEKNPDLSFAPTLKEGPLRVRDVVAQAEMYLVHVITESGKRDVLFFDEQASEWFTTTDREVADLAA